MFSPIFVADTKIICNYNFAAPLKKQQNRLTLTLSGAAARGVL